MAHLKRQEIEAALKWLRKSQSLNPSAQTEQLIAMALKKQGGASSSSRPAPPKAPSPPKNTAPSFSKDQKDLVERIVRLKDYYQILGVEREAKEEDLKRAYRKLAIKLHPDKNQAPGSQEAFKLIAKAYDCLSNQERRAHYDRFGEETPQRRQHQQQHYEEVFNPEDIFQAFFSGGFGPAFQAEHVYFNGQRVRRPQQRAQQRPAQQFNLGSLIPLLFLFFTVVSNLGLMGSGRLQDRVYSLRQSYSFPQRHLTQHNQPFYAASNFKQKYAQSSSERRQVYEEVDRAWQQHWGELCQQQSQNKHYLERYAAMSQGTQRQHYQDKADSIDMTSCQKYQWLRSAMAGA